MKEFPMIELVRARDYYLSSETRPPYSFYVSHSFKDGWKCRFLPYGESMNDDYIKWFPDTETKRKSLNLFFSMDIDSIRKGIKNTWETEWNCA